MPLLLPPFLFSLLQSSAKKICKSLCNNHCRRERIFPNVTSGTLVLASQFFNSVTLAEPRRSLTPATAPGKIDLSHYAISFIDKLADAAKLGSCLNLKFYLPFKLSNKTPYQRHQSPMRTRHRDFLHTPPKLPS